MTSKSLSVGQIQGLFPSNEITVDQKVKLIVKGSLRVSTIQNSSGLTTLTSSGSNVNFVSNLTTSATLSASQLSPTRLILPIWTTATRPGNPQIGTIGYNSTTSKGEVYNGTGWINIESTLTTTAVPLTISGITAWYDGNSWNSASNRWDDLSGNGRNTDNTAGSVTRTFASGAGSNGLTYITGNTGAGVRVPTSAWPGGSNYTFFHVTRYTGGTRGRIWQGTSGNWLSGHWSSRSGSFYHEGWMSDGGSTNYYGDNWILVTDQPSFVRVNRGNRTFSGGGFSPTSVAINGAGSGGCCNTSETSDWATAEVIIYNRILSATEYESVENYLYSKHALTV
jgi:hypothetical protein